MTNLEPRNIMFDTSIDSSSRTDQNGLTVSVSQRLRRLVALSAFRNLSLSVASRSSSRVIDLGIACCTMKFTYSSAILLCCPLLVMEGCRDRKSA